MSQENVEIVRRCLDAYHAGDLAASAAELDPDVEFDVARPEGEIFRGHEGVAEGMRSWTGAFEGWDFEIEDAIDAGDQVLVVTRESGRGKASGIEIDQENFHLVRLRDGKIVRWKLYVDRGEALEAAGLRE